MTDEEMEAHLERVYAACQSECLDRTRDRGGECTHLCQRVERAIEQFKASEARQRSISR